MGGRHELKLQADELNDDELHDDDDDDELNDGDGDGELNDDDDKLNLSDKQFFDTVPVDRRTRVRLENFVGNFFSIAVVVAIAFASSWDG